MMSPSLVVYGAGANCNIRPFMVLVCHYHVPSNRMLSSLQHVGLSLALLALTTSIITAYYAIKNKHKPSAGDSAAVWFSSLLASLFFVCHPLHVEVIGWSSAGGYPLAGLFYVLSIKTYLQAYWEDGISPRSYYLNICSSCIFYVLAVLSKSVAISLPAAIVTLDWLLSSASLPPSPSREEGGSDTRALYTAMKAWLRQMCIRVSPYAILCALSVLLIIAANDIAASTDIVHLSLGEKILKFPVEIAHLIHSIAAPVPHELRPHYM